MIARLPEEATQRLAEAAEWRLLALLFSRPRRGWADEIASLSPEVRDPALREIASLAQGAQEGPYHALLGPGAAASAREVAYCGFTDPGRLLAELNARYDAFAFAPGSEEPADHLSVEADFVAYLLIKEVHAMASAETAAAEVTREARARFLAEHLAILGRGFAERIASGPAHLVAAAGALSARLAQVPIARPGPDRCADPLELECPMSHGGRVEP